jgi:hypothetical protein
MKDSTAIERTSQFAINTYVSLRTRVPFVHVIFVNTSVVVSCFKSVSVSRARHLPFVRGTNSAVTPVPCPSVHGQSLPKISLS